MTNDNPTHKSYSLTPEQWEVWSKIVGELTLVEILELADEVHAIKEWGHGQILLAIEHGIYSFITPSKRRRPRGWKNQKS